MKRDAARKEVIKANREFWSSLYLKIDKEIKKYISKNDFIDFDILMSYDKPKSIIVFIKHKSKNNLGNLTPYFKYEDYVVEFSFKQE